MIAIDTNILVGALAAGHVNHAKAEDWLRSLTYRSDIIISEFVLVELYGLLCNPVVFSKALRPQKAAEICQSFRRHPQWRLFGFPPDSTTLHEAMWIEAAKPGVSKRRVYDVRLALSLYSTRSYRLCHSQC
jgi:uncharacterized protein